MILMLNADMSPLKTISIQRTLSLMMKDKVDILETVPGKMLRSPSVSFPLPSVIRLRYYKSVPRRNAIWSRRGVFARDGYKCVFCGKSLSREDATVDHLIPREICSKEGIKASTWSNSVTSCGFCNRKKANRRLEDSGMKFIDPNYIPKTPRANYLVLSGEVPREWKEYIKTG